MAVPRTSLRRVTLAAAFVITILVLLWFTLPHFQPTRVRGQQMANLLSTAQTVTVREYRDYLGGMLYAELLTERKLTTAQTQQLATTLKAHSWLADAGKACLFNPHHQLACTMPDDSTHIIHICFACGDIALDDGPPMDMRGWEPDIRKLLETAGVPIRENLYRYNPAI